MSTEMKFFVGYLCFISAVTVILTIYDKIAAKSNPRHRIPENTLIYMGVLGGAAAEYVTMVLIRHKTKHKKFMVGLPVIIAIHAAAAIIVYKLR